MPGRNCPISFAVLRISECEAMASFPDATSRSSQAASTFSPRIARVPPGTASTSATHEIEPFCTPCEPGGAHGREAARLEVEHREPLRGAHERLGARARGEAHLDSAGGVGGAEERLRPRRVVAVDEDGLGAVDRERLGVGDEAADRELQVPPLLDRALRHARRGGRSASRRGARSRSAARTGRRRPSSRSRRSRGARPRPRRRRAAPGSP